MGGTPHPIRRHTRSGVVHRGTVVRRSGHFSFLPLHLRLNLLLPAHNSSCCTTPHSVPTQACFVPISDPAFERCVDPLPFLDTDTSTPKRRCTSAVDCGHAHLCVRPRSDQDLLALTLHILPWLRNDDGDVERTVVWQGDSSEILRDGQFLLSHDLTLLSNVVLLRHSRGRRLAPDVPGAAHRPARPPLATLHVRPSYDSSASTLTICVSTIDT